MNEVVPSMGSMIKVGWAVSLSPGLYVSSPMNLQVDLVRYGSSQSQLRAGPLEVGISVQGSFCNHLLHGLIGLGNKIYGVLLLARFALLWSGGRDHLTSLLGDCDEEVVDFLEIDVTHVWV